MSRMGRYVMDVMESDPDVMCAVDGNVGPHAGNPHGATEATSPNTTTLRQFHDAWDEVREIALTSDYAAYPRWDALTMAADDYAAQAEWSGWKLVNWQVYADEQLADMQREDAKNNTHDDCGD